MPWCPKCKAEYQEGYTECSDCKVALVDKLEEPINFEPFFQTENENVAEKLVKFFEYSELKSEINYDEKNEMYIVSVPAKQHKQAKKLYQAFYFVELDRKVTHSDSKDNPAGESDLEKEADDITELSDDMDVEPVVEQSDTEEENVDYSEDVPSDDITSIEEDPSEAFVYVMKSDQFKDLSGTVWIFMTFGIAGLAVVLLNIAGILNFFNGWITNSIMGVLFLSFIYIAISTNKKAKKVQAEIDAENELTERINKWLNVNINESFLESIHDDSISEELNFMRGNDIIKEMLIKEFGPQNLAYLDQLIDEFYNKTFD